MFMVRLQRIQNEEGPKFERYVADNDPLFLEACRKNTVQLLEQIRADRQAILNLLFSLDEPALRRIASHPRYGQMDVIRWMEFFLLHEAHHLFTIFMLTADLRTSLHL
jgi:hypothetical protein